MFWYSLLPPSNQGHDRAKPSNRDIECLHHWGQLATVLAVDQCSNDPLERSRVPFLKLILDIQLKNNYSHAINYPNAKFPLNNKLLAIYLTCRCLPKETISRKTMEGALRRTTQWSVVKRPFCKSHTGCHDEVVPKELCRQDGGSKLSDFAFFVPVGMHMSRPTVRGPLLIRMKEVQLSLTRYLCSQAAVRRYKFTSLVDEAASPVQLGNIWSTSKMDGRCTRKTKQRASDPRKTVVLPTN